MLFKRIKTPGIAHASYVVGDKGEVAVVDPRRDIDVYLDAARADNASIKYVIETHRQEDFVLGSAELARVTGAKIVNGRHELYGHGDIRLADGEDFEFAGIRLRALHTPGHTPESTCFAVFLTDAPHNAWGLFSGDTLFIGETGRTDLSDRAKTGENAGHLYDAIFEKIVPLGDQTLIFPAHGSGSVCGGNIAQRDDSTLGFERTYNPVFKQSRAKFIAAKIAERIPRPPYFRQMEKVNLKGGIPLAKAPNTIKLLAPKKLKSEMGAGIVLDARDPEAFAAGHIESSFSLWKEGLPVFGGWLSGRTGPIFLVLDRHDDLEDAVLSLARIGVDSVEGVLAGGFDAWRTSGLPIARSGAISARELSEKRSTYQVLDVRDDSEFEKEGHVPGASHLYVGYLEEHTGAIRPALDKKRPVAVVCSVGHRAGLATSMLLRQGFPYVDNVLGGMTAWEKLDLNRENGPENTVTTPEIEGERK